MLTQLRTLGRWRVDSRRRALRRCSTDFRAACASTFQAPKTIRLRSAHPGTTSEIIVPRDEILLVHATGPRGDVARRNHTTLQILRRHSPAQVDGALTDARIEYPFHGRRLETRTETLIVNREQIDWVEAVLPGELEFPEGPRRPVASPA